MVLTKCAITGQLVPAVIVAARLLRPALAAVLHDWPRCLPLPATQAPPAVHICQG